MISVSVKSNRRLSKVNIKEKAMRPLSYTQIALYQSHSLCYKLQYIDGLKSNDRWYLSFGQSRLKQIIVDEAVTEDMKIRLETLKQVISSSPKLLVRRFIKEK